VLPVRTQVLVADHSEAMKAACRVLSLNCEVVASVADSGALLEAARRFRPDVMLFDVNLPGVHGLQACRRITHVNPAIKVIMVTIMSEPDACAETARRCTHRQ
jgi:CheY-like chemotaxis protein